jgi:hypothetical protein
VAASSDQSRACGIFSIYCLSRVPSVPLGRYAALRKNEARGSPGSTSASVREKCGLYCRY